MSKDKIDCTCGKCSCTDLEEHKKNRQDETCKCECQDKNIDTATELETITVIGTPAPTRPTIIDWKQPETPVVPVYPTYPNTPINNTRYILKLLDNISDKNLKNRIQKIGKKRIYATLSNPRKIKILIAQEGKNPNSWWGHVAISINDLEFGMSPNGWDIRSEHTFINKYTQELHRSVRSYELSLTNVQKMAVVNSLLNAMQVNVKYDILNYSCSSSMVRIFANANINIVDARNTIPGIYRPLDIENYLQHTVKNNKITNYPSK